MLAVGASKLLAGDDNGVVSKWDVERGVQELTLREHSLGVRALGEGELSIDGVAWTLNDVAHGEHTLALHGRRLNTTKAERVGKVYAFDQSLRMRVVPPMPLLQAHIEGMPSTMLLGQLVKTTLVLANVGRTSLCEAKLRMSQPAFCMLAETPPSPRSPLPAAIDFKNAKFTAVSVFETLFETPKPGVSAF